MLLASYSDRSVTFRRFVTGFPGVRVCWARVRGAAVRVRVRHTANGHTGPVRVVALRQLRPVVVPERRVLDVRVWPKRFAVHRSILPLQEPGQVPRRDAVRPGQRVPRVLLHMFLFRVHVRAHHHGHMVPVEQAVRAPARRNAI